MRSTAGLNMLDIDCGAKVSQFHEDPNSKGTPIVEERSFSYTSTGAESEGGGIGGNKRRSTAVSHNKPKRITRNHSKSTKAKEVLRSLLIRK